jgi:hypothetical protein
MDSHLANDLANDSIVQDTLSDAASQLKNRFLREEGNTYAVEDLQKALGNWLQLSVESLLDDVLFHVVEGDRAYAFNRRAFEIEIQRLQPVSSEKPALVRSESVSSAESSTIAA